jgi:hypothetical protein
MTYPDGSLAWICALTGKTKGRLRIGAGKVPALTTTVTVLLAAVYVFPELSWKLIEAVFVRSAQACLSGRQVSRGAERQTIPTIICLKFVRIGFPPN